MLLIAGKVTELLILIMMNVYRKRGIVANSALMISTQATGLRSKDYLASSPADDKKKDSEKGPFPVPEAGSRRCVLSI